LLKTAVWQWPHAETETKETYGQLPGIAR